MSAKKITTKNKSGTLNTIAVIAARKMIVGRSMQAFIA